jgi:hypothetical protein
MKRTFSTALVPATLLALGCGEAEPDENFGVDPSFTEDAFYATDADVGGAYVAGDPADQVAADDGGDFLTLSPPPSLVNPELVAARAGGAVDRYFSPAGCATVTLLGAEVTYSLERCTGPLGLRDLTGQIRVRYEARGDELSMSVDSSDLTTAGRAVTLDLEVTRSALGESDRRLRITSNTSVAGERSILYRELDLEVRYVPNSGCVEVTGRGDVDVDERAFTYTLDGYSRCSGQCPASGILTLEDASDSASLRFDGSNRPDYATSDRRSGELLLECEP